MTSRRLSTFLFIVVAISIQAAPPPPPVTPPCWPPPCIPIDGGIGFLMAAGVAYGAKKLYQFKKEKSTKLD
ncbi:MAG: PID-CTERM protein-sorting domain-containing protein [Bacteroidia bacterium]